MPSSFLSSESISSFRDVLRTKRLNRTTGTFKISNAVAETATSDVVITDHRIEAINFSTVVIVYRTPSALQADVFC